MQNMGLIKVWDPLVRVFHWSLVASFIIAFATGDDFIQLHSWAGYVIFGLLAIRLVWGFIGPRYARFSNFTYSPATIKRFLKDTMQFKAKRYLGHNPAGGAMVLLLMLSLLLACVTGLLALGAEEHTGPLASWFTGRHPLWGDIAEESHEFFANFTLLLVFIHVIGVLFESFIHKENLVTAMINGFKHNNNPTENQ